MRIIKLQEEPTEVNTIPKFFFCFFHWIGQLHSFAWFIEHPLYARQCTGHRGTGANQTQILLSPCLCPNPTGAGEENQLPLPTRPYYYLKLMQTHGHFYFRGATCGGKACEDNHLGSHNIIIRALLSWKFPPEVWHFWKVVLTDFHNLLAGRITAFLRVFLEELEDWSQLLTSIFSLSQKPLKYLLLVLNYVRMICFTLTGSSSRVLFLQGESEILESTEHFVSLSHSYMNS